MQRHANNILSTIRCDLPRVLLPRGFESRDVVHIVRYMCQWMKDAGVTGRIEVQGVSRDHVMLLHSVDHVASPNRFTSTTAHNSIVTTQQWQPPPPNERMASSQSPMVPIRPSNPRKSHARPQRYKTHHS